MLAIVLVVGIAVANAAIANRPCPTANSFSCGDGSCIPTYFRCDNIVDCTNEADESECNYVHKCPSNQFMCLSGECLPRSQRCDGHFDCQDESDERGCQNVPQPTIEVSIPPFTSTQAIRAQKAVQCDAPDFFYCRLSNKCVDGHMRCDGRLDCTYGEDEMHCEEEDPLADASRSDCADGNHFYCSPSQCVSMSMVCNGELDCASGLDEKHCPLSATSVLVFSASVIGLLMVALLVARSRMPGFRARLDSCLLDPRGSARDVFRTVSTHRFCPEPPPTGSYSNPVYGDHS